MAPLLTHEVWNKFKNLVKSSGRNPLYFDFIVQVQSIRSWPWSRNCDVTRFHRLHPLNWSSEVRETGRRWRLGSLSRPSVDRSVSLSVYTVGSPSPVFCKVPLLSGNSRNSILIVFWLKMLVSSSELGYRRFGTSLYIEVVGTQSRRAFGLYFDPSIVSLNCLTNSGLWS